MINIIDYVPGQTLLHRLNPVTKLALAAAIIAATFLADSYALLLVLLALTFALAAYARVAGRLAPLLKVLVPLAVVMFALQLVFVRTGAPVWGIVTTDGLVTGSKVCLRLLGVALPLILVLMVTKLTDLANACVEVLHVPYRYAFTFTTDTPALNIFIFFQIIPDSIQERRFHLAIITISYANLGNVLLVYLALKAYG